jgi:sulfur carrier protein
MKVKINGNEKDVPQASTVKKILEGMKLDGKYLAVAVNTDFLPRTSYGDIPLKEGDEIEIVSPQSGG